jgi:hypothetical protein
MSDYNRNPDIVSAFAKLERWVADLKSRREGYRLLTQQRCAPQPPRCLARSSSTRRPASTRLRRHDLERAVLGGLVQVVD